MLSLWDNKSYHYARHFFRIPRRQLCKWGKWRIIEKSEAGRLRFFNGFFWTSFGPAHPIWCPGTAYRDCRPWISWYSWQTYSICDWTSGVPCVPSDGQGRHCSLVAPPFPCHNPAKGHIRGTPERGVLPRISHQHSRVRGTGTGVRGTFVHHAGTMYLSLWPLRRNVSPLMPINCLIKIWTFRAFRVPKKLMAF